ncbi:hypothetical protein F2Q69_00017536 [Brassica cretica]|uniref:Uncharacterized protein n=1 Tax=Brassica cretica TaxID=69181 RepID=A0A8S9QMN6_BRACR|nr:hypothetical protein F2Q69_00017536 [Brassica cretica]
MEEGEEKGNLRTVECLRGRLLAERQVSSSEGSEQLSSSEVSCLSSVSTSASKEEGEEKETHGNGFVEQENIDQETENVASVEEEKEELSSKIKDVSSGEESVVASTSSHEAESQASNDFS